MHFNPDRLAQLFEVPFVTGLAREELRAPIVFSDFGHELVPENVFQFIIEAMLGQRIE